MWRRISSYKNISLGAWQANRTNSCFLCPFVVTLLQNIILNVQIGSYASILLIMPLKPILSTHFQEFSVLVASGKEFLCNGGHNVCRILPLGSLQTATPSEIQQIVEAPIFQSNSSCCSLTTIRGFAVGNASATNNSLRFWKMAW